MPMGVISTTDKFGSVWLGKNRHGLTHIVESPI